MKKGCIKVSLWKLGSPIINPKLLIINLCSYVIKYTLMSSGVSLIKRLLKDLKNTKMKLCKMKKIKNNRRILKLMMKIVKMINTIHILIIVNNDL